MKTIFPYLLITLLILGTVKAQNPMFLSFGLSQDEAKTKLSRLDYLDQITELPDRGVMVVQLEGSTVEYTFRQNMLYAIRVTQFYDKGKVARKALKGGVNYFKLVEGEMLRPGTGMADSYVVSLEENRVMELSSRNHAGSVAVSLVATSRIYGPRNETEAYVRDLFASN